MKQKEFWTSGWGVAVGVVICVTLLGGPLVVAITTGQSWVAGISLFVLILLLAG